MVDFTKINAASFRKYFTTQAVKDLDTFLDALPVNVGYNILAVVGLAWIIAASAVIFTSMEVEKVSKIRADLMKVEAMKPPVPIVKYTPVEQSALKSLAEKINTTYKGVNVLAGASGGVTISAGDTDYFPQFLGALLFLQNGGKNWRVRIDSLCVGKDCPTSKLSAILRVETARVGEPPKAEEEDNNDNKAE